MRLAITKIALMMAYGVASAQQLSSTNGIPPSGNGSSPFLFVSAFAGTDIGAQVNAAISALPLLSGIRCGTVVISPGTYSWTTEIVKPRCVTILGGGALATVLHWTTKTGVALQIADAGSAHGYPQGELADLTLSGPGTSTRTTGLYFGDTYPSLVQFGDFQNVNRARIAGWGTGIDFGSNAYNITLNQSLITSNGTGVLFSANRNANSGESIIFNDSAITNNTVRGLDLTGFGDFYFFGGSCDYNLTCGTVNIAHFFGTHFEGSGGRMLTVKGVSESAVEILGGYATYTGSTGSDPDFFYVDPTADPNSHFHISGTIVNLGHAVANLVSWNISGANAQLSIENLPYMGGGAPTALTNSSCAFVGCHIQDVGGTLAFQGTNAALSPSGDWRAASFFAAGGAGIGRNTGGTGWIYGNGTLRLDHSKEGTTPCFLTRGSLNCSGNTFTANSIQAGEGVAIINSSAVPQIGSPPVNQVACIKATGPPVVIGYCSTAITSKGGCTCN